MALGSGNAAVDHTALLVGPFCPPCAVDSQLLNLGDIVTPVTSDQIRSPVIPAGPLLLSLVDSAVIFKKQFGAETEPSSVLQLLVGVSSLK